MIVPDLRTNRVDAAGGASHRIGMVCALLHRPPAVYYA
jgi:hypothetical protein